jgi:hypothetical protein
MSTTATEQREALIHDDQIEAINAARAALDAIFKTNLYDFNSQTSGMVAALADVAADTLFQLLNTYNSHAGAGLTEAQLHYRRTAQT